MYDTITSRLDMKRNFITRYFQFLFVSFPFQKKSKQQRKEGKRKNLFLRSYRMQKREKNNLIGLGQVLNASESFQMKKKVFFCFPRTQIFQAVHFYYMHIIIKTNMNQFVNSEGQ